MEVSRKKQLSIVNIFQFYKKVKFVQYLYTLKRGIIAYVWVFITIKLN